MESVGTLTLGTGTEQERTIQIIEMLRAEFKDHRLATVAKDEEGNYLLSIENPLSTGRASETKMYLSEGSFMAILFAAHVYLGEKKIDLEQKLKEYCLNENEVQFEYHFSEEEQ